MNRILQAVGSMLLACAVFAAAWGVPAVDAAVQARERTIFVVRHAERADTVGGAAPTMKADPGLSEAGRTRAAALASMLRDAGVQQIFVTEYKRTQETAAPLAKASGVVPEVLQANDVPGLVARLREGSGNALVVGHSNTVPQVLKALGMTAAVTIGDSEYDNLFIVTGGEAPSFLRLHF